MILVESVVKIMFIVRMIGVMMSVFGILMNVVFMIVFCR